MVTGRCPKILHVSIGGPILRSFFAGQLADMCARGFEVVVAARGGPDLERLCLTEGAWAYPVEVVRPLRPWRDLPALIALVRIVAAERPDIVHGHTPKAALLGLLAGWLAGVPHRFYHLRSLPLESQDEPARWLLRVSESLTARLATEVVAISDSLRRTYLTQAGIRRRRITVLGSGSGNGVDAVGRFDPAAIQRERLAAFRRRIGLPEGARAICFVGRLAKAKGLAELHGAWQRLRRRHPDLWLVVAGGADEREPVGAALIGDLRADRRVSMAGFVYERELVYALATVNVLPSHREGFGNVLIEAAAMTVPSVATRVTGCVDAVVDGATGTLVPPRDPAALAAAIGRYLNDPDLCRRHGAAARRRALDQFRPERIWSALAALYRSSLAAAERARAIEPRAGVPTRG